MSERAPDDGSLGVVRRNLRSSASKPEGRAKHETQVSRSEARGVFVASNARATGYSGRAPWHPG